MSVFDQTCSPNAELAVLCACVTWPDTLDWLDVQRSDFGNPNNAEVFEASRAMHEEGRPIDPVTLEAELERRGTLRSVGGLDYIATVVEAVASKDNVEHYADILREGRIAREALVAASTMIGRVKSNDLRGADAVDWLVAKLGRISRRDASDSTCLGSTLPKFAQDLVAQAEDVAKGATVTAGVATGIESIDTECGGLPRGVPGVVAARPGEGKSSFLRTVATNVAEAGGGAVVFTYEDKRDKWQERWLADASGVPLERISRRQLNGDDLRAITDAVEAKRSQRMLHVVHAHGMSVSDMRREATVLARRMGRLDFIGVDYAQLMPAPERGMKKHDSISANAEAMAEWVGQTDAAMLIGSQLLKELEKEERRPRLGDLRYGEGLAIVAKAVFLLHDPKSKPYPNDHEVLIAKFNQGRRGVKVTVNYDREHNRIT